MPTRGYGNIHNCASCQWALLATSQAAPYWVLRSPVRLLQNVGGCSLLPVGLLLIGHSSHWCGCSAMLGCAHATVSVGAATKKRVAKDMALHVQYLLKSILCNSHEQIQQLTLSQQQCFSFYTVVPPSSVITAVQSPRRSPRSLDTGWPIGCKMQGSSRISF